MDLVRESHTVTNLPDESEVQATNFPLGDTVMSQIRFSLSVSPMCQGVQHRTMDVHIVELELTYPIR